MMAQLLQYLPLANFCLMVVLTGLNVYTVFRSRR
jgi:hypothetical protein